MMKVQPAITQMNNGHISPILEGRTDVQIYNYSCRQTENSIPLVYGANKNRGGTVYVSSTKYLGVRAALVPFKVGENVSYQLEFGDNYIRVFKDHAPVMYNGEPYEIETPYHLTDLFDSNGVFQIDYQQSADVLYLVHDKYPVAKLMRFGDTNWAISIIDFQNGPWENRNADKRKVIRASATTGTVTLSGYAGENPTATFPRLYVPYSGNWGAAHVEIWLNGHEGTKLAEKTWTAPVPNNTWGELVAMTANSVSDLVATNPTRTSCIITAVSNQLTYDGNSISVYLSVTDGVLIGSKWHDSQFTSSGDPVETFDDSWVGRLIRLFPETANNNVWTTGKAVTQGDIYFSDNKYYKATSSGTTGQLKPVHTDGIVSDGAVSWEYLHPGYGTAQIQSVTSAYEAVAKVVDYLPDGVVDESTYKWQLSLIGAQGIYPSSVAFFKDRLTFGINASTGPTLCFSKTGDYENFDDLTYNEVLADNAITLPILSDLNKIQWLCAQDNLFVGTEGGIVMVKAMTDSEVFGPNNVTYDEISNIGTCKIKPVRIGDEVLYLGRTAKDIYAIAYNFQSDSYEPDEVSLSAYDLLEQGITSWALQYEPNRIVWMVRRDGKLVGFTYNKKQQVRAFHLHSTKGNVESISCIPSPDGTADEVWITCDRGFTNSYGRYVEYLHNGLPLDIPYDKYADKKDLHEYMLKHCVYLDSAKVYTFNPASDSLTGLGHLEGQEVGIVADGVYVGQKTVYQGNITLNSAATNVVVGVPYVSIVEPMPLNVDMQNGSGQARSQRINQLVARIYRTAGFEYSWGKEWHKAPVRDDFSLDLMSGDLILSWGDSNTEIKLNPQDIVNSTGSRMIFRQTEPLPVYFVSFYPSIEVSNG